MKYIKSKEVDVEKVSFNHHEEVQGRRDGMVSQDMLESTINQQIDDPSTVSVALLTVMSESQVNSGEAAQCRQSAHSICMDSHAVLTVCESGAKPKIKSANPEVEVKSKPKFKINNISGGKFSLKLSRRLVLEEVGGGKSDIDIGVLKGKRSEHTPDYYLQNKTRSKNFTQDKFRGENVGLKHFNNIPIFTTPTKRKLEEGEKENGGTVKTLIDIFTESTNSSQPENDVSAESPAKRRRWGYRGEGH